MDVRLPSTLQTPSFSNFLSLKFDIKAAYGKKKMMKVGIINEKESLHVNYTSKKEMPNDGSQRKKI